MVKRIFPVLFLAVLKFPNGNGQSQTAWKTTPPLYPHFRDEDRISASSSSNNYSVPEEHVNSMAFHYKLEPEQLHPSSRNWHKRSAEKCKLYRRDGGSTGTATSYGSYGTTDQMMSPQGQGWGQTPAPMMMMSDPISSLLAPFLSLFNSLGLDMLSPALLGLFGLLGLKGFIPLLLIACCLKFLKLLLTIALLLFVPIPILNLGRNFETNAKDRLLSLTQNVLGSEECLERISCNISKLMGNESDKSFFDIPKKFGMNVDGELSAKIQKGFKTTKSCSKFKCSLFTKF